MTFESCSSCKQSLMFIPSCPCRNYKVWDVEHDEEDAMTITHVRSFLDAAEEYVERLELSKEATFLLCVKNFRGEIKKVRVDATVRVDLESSIEEEEMTA